MSRGEDTSTVISPQIFPYVWAWACTMITDQANLFHKLLLLTKLLPGTQASCAWRWCDSWGQTQPGQSHGGPGTPAPLSLAGTVSLLSGVLVFPALGPWTEGSRKRTTERQKTTPGKKLCNLIGNTELTYLNTQESIQTAEQISYQLCLEKSHIHLLNLHFWRRSLPTHWIVCLSVPPSALLFQLAS